MGRKRTPQDGDDDGEQQLLPPGVGAAMQTGCAPAQATTMPAAFGMPGPPPGTMAAMPGMPQLPLGIGGMLPPGLPGVGAPPGASAPPQMPAFMPPGGMMQQALPVNYGSQIGANAAAPPPPGVAPGYVAGPPAMQNSQAMTTNPLLAMTAQQNPMFAMAMMGGMSNTGGIAGNIAMPKPAAPAPEEPKKASEPTAPDPDIVELFDHYHIDPRHLSRFQGLMEKREETFASDMLKLWELMEQARSPEGMLVSKMREMECGTFIGKTVPDDALLDLSRKFKLDSEAEAKLSDVLAKYDHERRQQYMKELERHLETSSRPSAMVMMCLKKLGEGLPLGRPGPAAHGSYVDRQKRDRDDARRPREKDYRPRSPGGGRNRSRDRSADRSRNRRGRETDERRRSRSRSGRGKD